MRYHLTPDGPKPCSATKIACRYGEHFENKKDAQGAFENDLSETVGFNGLKSNTSGELAAEVSRAYAHWSIVNDHLHNASGTGNEAELIYYASAQGQLELARRSRSKYNKEYLAIADRIKNGEPKNFELTVDPDALEKSIAAGEAHLLKDTSTFYLEDKAPRHNEELGHKLIELSHEWLKNLSPEQQEAVGWLTSNGFGMSQYALGIKNENAGHYFDGIIDENAIYDKHGADYKTAEIEIEQAKNDYAENYLSTVISAFEKVPRLKTPIVIARGTSIDELQDILGTDTTDTKSLFDSIEKGKFLNKEAPKNSRIRRGPQSATAKLGTSSSFAKRLWGNKVNEDREIVLAIKTTSVPSPVNVSAWSTGEYEIFTNPLSSYRVVGGRRGPRESFILELEELAAGQ